MEQATQTPSRLFRASGAGPAERGRLDATLARVGELYEALLVGHPGLDPVTVLSELRDDLALHFALEEAGPYFGAVVRERPSLGHGITELQHEHLALLERLDTLSPMADDPRRSAELAGAILDLIGEFRRHEHKETELLQELVLRDDGVAAD
jgi:hypothetical protein